MPFVCTASREAAAVNKNQHGGFFRLFGRINIKEKAVLAVSEGASPAKFLVVKGIYGGIILKCPVLR